MTLKTQQQVINVWGYNTIAKQILSPIILGLILFALAGTVDWLWGWIFNIVHVLVWSSMTLTLIINNPELLNARGKRSKGTKWWDNILLSIYGLAWLAMIVIGALDVRYGWTSEPFMVILPVLGCVLMILGFALTTWSMVVNRNFEVTVRIQDDRNHHVVTTGPYRYVRHPGYTGVIISFFIGMPLVLNSIPAFIPAVIGAIVIVIRTAMEDQTLQAELAGYLEYTRQTKYRLLSYVW